MGVGSAKQFPVAPPPYSPPLLAGGDVQAATSVRSGILAALEHLRIVMLTASFVIGPPERRLAMTTMSGSG